MHRPVSELKTLLEEAQQQVSIGSRWTHYKRPDQTYVVTGITVEKSTDLPMVLYAGEYGARLSFARPLANWLSLVNINGKEVERFRRS